MSDEPTLGELGRRLDAIHSDVKTVLHDHESRLRGIEKWMYGVPASLVAAAASLAVAFLGR